MGFWRRPSFSQARWIKFNADITALKARLGKLSLSDLQKRRAEAIAYAGDLMTLARLADQDLRRRAIGQDRQEGLPEIAHWGYRPDALFQPIEPATTVAVQSPFDLTGGLKIFHDCTQSEIILRQTPRNDPHASAPFAISLEVFRFDGSFLSMALDVPLARAASVKLSDILQVSLDISMDFPIDLYARVNVIHGPNSEQMVRKMEWHNGRLSAEFDMAYSKVNDKRIEKIWIDLIFERPSMNLLQLGDFLVVCMPRAEL